MSPKQKVYQAVLTEIKEYIDKDNLQPGDKLPSERDLVNSLKVGRSSIREALRAMELLGLIETRSGQGTFLSLYKQYQTIELLASFVLQSSKTKDELFFAKKIIEKETAKLAFNQLNDQDIDELELIIRQDHEGKHSEFFHFLFQKAGNLLLMRIWSLMEEFSQTVIQSHYGKMFYEELVEIYKSQKYDSIEELFDLGR